MKKTELLPLKKVPIYPRSVRLTSIYHIYLAIRQGFPLSRVTTNNLISPMKSCYYKVLFFLNNPKDLKLSYNRDLDFFLLFWKEKNPVL